jgi:hypothetical protein
VAAEDGVAEVLVVAALEAGGLAVSVVAARAAGERAAVGRNGVRDDGSGKTDQ